MYGSQEIQTKKQHSLPPTKKGYSMRDKRTHDIHPVRDKSIRHSQIRQLLSEYHFVIQTYINKLSIE